MVSFLLITTVYICPKHSRVVRPTLSPRRSRKYFPDLLPMEQTNKQTNKHQTHNHLPMPPEGETLAYRNICMVFDLWRGNLTVNRTKLRYLPPGLLDETDCPYIFRGYIDVSFWRVR